MTKRTPVIAGNWKMNTDIKSSRELALQILELTDEVTGVTKIVCPPFVTIAEVSELLHGRASKSAHKMSTLTLTVHSQARYLYPCLAD